VDAFAVGVGDAEADASFVAGLVGGVVGVGFDFEFVSGLDEDKPVVADGARVAAEEVGTEVDGAC